VTESVALTPDPDLKIISGRATGAASRPEEHTCSRGRRGRQGCAQHLPTAAAARLDTIENLGVPTTSTDIDA
jgi:hypothetical protein